MKFVFGMIALLISVPMHGQDLQSFEGKIAYAVTVESRHEKVPHELLVESYGTSATVYFKGGNTRMQWHDGRAEFEIFLAAENKQYMKMRGEHSLTVGDASEEKREILDFRDEASQQVVLGRPTRVITIEYKDGSVSRYWYDPEIYIDPEPFKELRFAYLDRYWQTARAPYLKHERVTAPSAVTYTAIEIRREEVDNGMFSLPSVPE